MTHPLLLSLALALASPAVAASGKPFFPYPVRTTRLPNGLTAVRVAFPSPGLAAYYTVVRVGSRNEVEPDHSGFAHFFEHIMFKGTPRWPAGTREDLVGKLGYGDNAFTSADVTVYTVSGPATGLEQVIEVEADRFRNLDYTQEVFQTEAKAILGEYNKNAANPDRKLHEVLSATAFTQHPYQHTTLGFYEDIQKMPGYYAYSKAFFRRWYTPDNTLLIVVGDFDDAKVMAAIEKHYGSWKGKAARVVIPVEPPQKQERTATLPWATPTLPRHLHAWHAPGATPSLREAAIQNVLATYLAGPTSPLYKQLVLEKQLVESVYSGYRDSRDPSLFSLVANLKEEKSRGEVAAAFDATVQELSSGKVDAPRLQAVKDNLRFSLLMSLETPSDVAVQLGYSTGLFGQPGALDALYQAMSKVSDKDLVSFSRKYLVPTNRTVIHLTSGGAR